MVGKMGMKWVYQLVVCWALLKVERMDDWLEQTMVFLWVAKRDCNLEDSTVAHWVEMMVVKKAE